MTITTRQVGAALATFRARTGDLIPSSVMQECIEAAERERIAEDQEACDHPQRFGKGEFNDDGTIAVEWNCNACGKTWNTTEPAKIPGQ